MMNASANNGETGNGQAPKRTNDDDPRMTAFLRQTMKKVRGLEPPSASIGSFSGPIYEQKVDSFVLKSMYPKNPCDAWDRKTNPNGVVPVVVHPKLVSGLDSENPKKLTPEQQEGVQFLWNCYEKGEGGILAHDMGLGKTRTGITFVATLLQQSKNSVGKSAPGIKKCLIIAPKAAVTVWHSELELWVPDDIPCKVVVVKPGQKDGWSVVNEFMSPDSIKNVMIVSYETFLKYNSGYDNLGFSKNATGVVDLVICDEAHVLKNPDTGRVKSLKKFVGPKLWVGCTGTPYQNNLEELCHLVSFFRRDLCNNKDIIMFSRSVTEALRKRHRLNDGEKEHLQKLRELLIPALHYKLNCLNIEKHTVTICVPLDGHPNYGKRLDKLTGSGSQPSAVADDGNGLGDNDDEQKEDGIIGIQHEMYKILTECLEDSEIPFFEKLSYLLKACIHPQHLYDAALGKRPQILSKVIECFEKWAPKNYLTNPVIKVWFPVYSAKINVVARMAQHLQKHCPNEKMIIVSSSTVLLGMIKEFFSNLKLTTVVFDGETSEAARDRNLKLFETNENFRFLLLSLKAGGTALTLTRANHLVLMDPDYNPANDMQAIARIYRPSQEKTAFIYRLLATGTLEEVKFTRQLEKEDMKQCFQPEGSVNVQSIYNEKELLEYKWDKASRLRDFLDQAQIANFNNNDDVDVILADELRESVQYTEAFQVPENLQLVREIWNYVSYAFHTAKVQEEAQKMVLTDSDLVVPT